MTDNRQWLKKLYFRKVIFIDLLITRYNLLSIIKLVFNNHLKNKSVYVMFDQWGLQTKNRCVSFRTGSFKSQSINLSIYRTEQALHIQVKKQITVLLLFSKSKIYNQYSLIPG